MAQLNIPRNNPPPGIFVDHGPNYIMVLEEYTTGATKIRAIK